MSDVNRLRPHALSRDLPFPHLSLKLKAEPWAMLPMALLVMQFGIAFCPEAEGATRLGCW